MDCVNCFMVTLIYKSITVLAQSCFHVKSAWTMDIPVRSYCLCIDEMELCNFPEVFDVGVRRARVHVCDTCAVDYHLSMMWCSISLKSE